MQSLARVYASNKTANASQMTIQNVRSPGATTISVDTVEGVGASFFGTMGTPHTFIDPQTNEEITVISEATAVDFSGHVNAGELEIDAIAEGYTDNGSEVGDIVIIRPTTQWADNLGDLLSQIMNDDGSLKAVTANPGWTDLSHTPTSVTANGNRSYSMVFNSTDLTGILSPGMRFRTTRTVAAPTQSASLNGTNQYFNKTSPAGMTFTDDFVAGAWIKLSSYALGGIISRFNGTSGWILYVNASGQIVLQGNNAGGSNASSVRSYQSVPLNKWVHISAQLDMSAFTATSTTSYIMIDGVSIPVIVERAGTNPTALIQAGNLEVGSFNGGTNLFPGKIAQAFVSSAKITQANVLTLLSQGITSALITANSIISAYSLSNATTDLNTTNANNLTAQNSATTTNADSPFGGQADKSISATLDYGIVKQVSISGGNTTVVVSVAEGCTIPTSGGLSATGYSTQKAPFGFPTFKNKWSLISYLKTALTLGASASTWYSGAATGSGSWALTLPIGEWGVKYCADVYTDSGSSQATTHEVTLSTVAGSETDSYWTGTTNIGTTSANVFNQLPIQKEGSISATTLTTVYMNAQFSGAIGNPRFNASAVGQYILAEDAYL